MRRFWIMLLALLIGASGPQPAYAVTTPGTTIRAYLGLGPQAGPVADAVDVQRGLIYRAFLGSRTVLVLRSSDMVIVRTWSLRSTIPAASALPQLVLSPDGNRLGLLITGAGRVEFTLFDPTGQRVTESSLPHDGRPTGLVLTAARAFILRSDAPILAFDGGAPTNLEPPAAVPGARLSADGTTLAYLTPASNNRVRLALLDVQTSAVRLTTFEGPADASYTLVAAGGFVYLASCGGLVEVELVSGNVTRALQTSDVGCLTDAVIDPARRVVAAIVFSGAGSTALVEVDIAAWSVTRRTGVAGGFGHLTPFWERNRLFVVTSDYRTAQPIFNGIFDIASGVLRPLPYSVTLTDGRFGFSSADVLLRQYDISADTWRGAVFGGAVTQTRRTSDGTLFASISGAIARIPASAATPDAFFLGGDDFVVAGDWLYSHDGPRIFVAERAGNTTRVLTQLEFISPQRRMLYDPALGRLIFPWVSFPRNALPQAGLAIVDTATGAADTSFVRSSDTIAAALDPETHRVYAVTGTVGPGGGQSNTGALATLDLGSGTQGTIAAQIVGVDAARPAVLQFDAARGLLAVKDATGLFAIDRTGRTVWRAPLAGNTLDLSGTVWAIGGDGTLAIIDPQTGSVVSRGTTSYRIDGLGQVGNLLYGFDARSGAVISALPEARTLQVRIEGLTSLATSLEVHSDVIILGDSTGSVSAIAPDPSPAGRGPVSAFAQRWQRVDGPVASGAANRSWTWGPVPWAVRAEPYAEGAQGLRIVEYRDKARMEVTRPGANPLEPWYVTNGLLVTEMVNGRVQLGDNIFEPAPCSDDPQRTGCASQTPLAGDLAGNVSAPGYADAARLMPPVARAIGQRVGSLLTRTSMGGEFALVDRPELATAETESVDFDEVTGHNIPRVFREYMDQRGPVLENNQLVTALVVDPLVAFGRPITDPFWADVRVAGVDQPVLIQLFERRVVTYTPRNPEQFRIEMGNVGQHYYLWRYGDTRW